MTMTTPILRANQRFERREKGVSSWITSLREKLSVSTKATHMPRVFCSLRYGEFALLIPRKHGIELLKEADICELPGLNKYVYGIATRNRDIIPVFDFRRQFGEAVNRSARRYVSVVSVEDIDIGLVCASRPRLVETCSKIRPSSVKTLPSILNGFVINTFRGTEVQVELDLRNFLKSLLENNKGALF